MIREPLSETAQPSRGAVLLVIGLLLGGVGVAFVAAVQTPPKPSVRIIMPSTASTEPSSTTTTVAPVQRLSTPATEPVTAPPAPQVAPAPSTTTTTLPPPIYGPGIYIVGNGPGQVAPGQYHVTKYGPDVQDPSENVCRFHTPATTYVYGSSGSGGPMDLTEGPITVEAGCVGWTKI